MSVAGAHLRRSFPISREGMCWHKKCVHTKENIRPYVTLTKFLHVCLVYGFGPRDAGGKDWRVYIKNEAAPRMRLFVLRGRRACTSWIANPADKCINGSDAHRQTVSVIISQFCASVRRRRRPQLVRNFLSTYIFALRSYHTYCFNKHKK